MHVGFIGLGMMGLPMAENLPARQALRSSRSIVHRRSWRTCARIPPSAQVCP